MDNRLDREVDTRDDFQRPDSWKPASLLPEFKKVPGWAYRWIRTSVMNEARDNLNVSSKMPEGWEPVKLADHAEMKLMVDQNSRFKDGVEIGGLLLCKIPQEFVDQRKAHYATQEKQQADAVDDSFLKQSDARMPLFSEKKATTSFGKGTATKKDYMTKDYLTYLRVYLPEDAWFTGGKNFDNPRFGTDLSRKYFGSIVKVPLGQSKEVEIRYALPKEIVEDYALKIQKQAGINDESVAVHIIYKDGEKKDYSTVLNSDFVLEK